MAKTQAHTNQNTTPAAKTHIQAFIEKRVVAGKLTQAQADTILAKWADKLAKEGKKDLTLTGKQISALSTKEILQLLAVIAFILGLADEKGVLL